MNHHVDESQLNDYIDDALDARERSPVHAHIAECAHCRAELEAMRALAADIARLPKDIGPARDLRADIAERIAHTHRVAVAPSPPQSRSLRSLRSLRPLRSRRRLRTPAMIAAAAALVITTATLTRWYVLQAPSPTTVPRIVVPAVMPATFRGEEARYLDAIADLQNTLDRERTELAPRTIEILERNLAIIDRAIAESRAALAQDPANRDLSRMVLSAYEQKLQLLQRARVSAL